MSTRRGFHCEKKPAPQNIGIIDRPARIKLNSIGKDASVDPSCQAGEDQITFIVRCKQSRAVAGKRCHLKADIFEGLLICENCKVILLVLILAQEPGIKILRAGPGKIKERRLTRIGRNLEIGVGTAQQQANPTRIIDKIGEVRESFILLSPIVDGVVAARWIFDPKIVLFVAAERRNN